MHISKQDESVVHNVEHYHDQHQNQPLANNTNTNNNNINNNNNNNGTPANDHEPSQDIDLHSILDRQPATMSQSESFDDHEQLQSSARMDDNRSGNNNTSNASSTPRISSPMPPSVAALMQLNHTGGSPSSASISSPPLSPSRLLPSGVAASVHLASIHSLHPQLDLKLNTRFMLMPSNDQIRELQTVIRDKATSRGNFKFYADRLIRLVVEEGLNQLPIENVDVQTPTGNVFNGIRYLKGNCGVSIVRSGESMEQGLRDCCRSIRIGKILIESDENNQARVLYAKFPVDIAQRKILVLYPIMSTGLAVIESVNVLLNHGVREENLILLNLFSSPRAAKIINSSFPRMFALTSDINPVSPNHFGQRYFGTD